MPKIDDPKPEGKLPFMPLYVTDFVSSTARMSPAERGAYILLLLAQWEDGDLPDDPETLRRIALCDREEWPSLWAGIKARFTTTEDGRLSHPRLARERETAVERYAARVASARKAINARWEKAKKDTSRNTSRNTDEILTTTTTTTTEGRGSTTVPASGSGSVSKTPRGSAEGGAQDAPPAHGRARPAPRNGFTIPPALDNPEGRELIEEAKRLKVFITQQEFDLMCPRSLRTKIQLHKANIPHNCR